MSGREDEAVAVDPIWVLRVELHEFVKENEGHGSTSHGEAGMARVRLLNSVDGEETNGVDALTRGNGQAYLTGYGIALHIAFHSQRPNITRVMSPHDNIMMLYV